MAAHRIAKTITYVVPDYAKHFMTNQQKLHRGIWPWTKGLKSRLPLHFKQRYIARWMHEPKPVHYQPDTRKFVADEFGVPVRIQNIPLPVFFPAEAEDMLWGGEGIVAGFRRKNNNMKKPDAAKLWMPRLSSRVFYSEILDTYMRTTVTRTTLDSIDAACGFDHYILSTSELDLQSRLGMRLKRKMLLALAKKTLYPDDPVKRNEVYAKYEKYVIPADEAEWVGLTLYEAERKQHDCEEAERLNNLRPLKAMYAEELLHKLKTEGPPEADQSPLAKTLGKLNPFKSKKD